MKHPLVSIIIPCKNDGEYLNSSVTSSIKQTYKNIEIIVVNDGSTEDKTNKTINDLPPSVLVINIPQSKGPSAARNLGIQHASGKYILPLDADDVIDPSYVEKAVKVFENDRDLAIVYCEARFIGRKRGKWHLPKFSIGGMLTDNCIFSASMFLRKDWQDVGGYNEALISGLEDYDFWLSLLSLRSKVYQIPEILFSYRIKTISRNKKFFKDKNDRIASTYIEILDRHKELQGRHALEVMKYRLEVIRVAQRYQKIQRLLKPISPSYHFFYLRNLINRKLGKL